MKAFINRKESCRALFYDGWMHFILLQHLNHNSLRAWAFFLYNSNYIPLEEKRSYTPRIA